MPVLLATETAVPANRHSQKDVTEAAAHWASESETLDPRLVERVFGRAGVEWRSSLQPLGEVFEDAPFADRNRTYREAIIEACVEVTQRLVATSRIQRPDFLVSSSCTGLMIPAVDAYVANRLALGPRLARLPITEAGCAGGAVALARACDYLLAHPDRTAFVLASEFSSLTFQARDFGPTNVVATALFADGTAGMVLAGDAHPSARLNSDPPACRLLRTHSHFVPDTLGAMGYDVASTGLRLILDRRLPEFLQGRLRAVAADFVQEAGFEWAQITNFAIHPGGRRVLDVVADELSLDAEAQESSRGVLREHGNMSSATLLFVLQRSLARTPAGGACLAIGFGPGFSIELSLWARPSR